MWSRSAGGFVGPVRTLRSIRATPSVGSIAGSAGVCWRRKRGSQASGARFRGARLGGGCGVGRLDPAIAETWATGSGGRLTLWTFTKINGSVVRLCDAGYRVTVDGDEYLPIGSPIASAEERVLGLGSNNTEYSAAFDIDAITEADLAAGLYNGATVRQESTSLDAPWVGRVTTAVYIVSSVTWNGYRWDMELEDVMALLGKRVGRTAKVVCDYDLGSTTGVGGCGVDLSGFTQTGTVASVDVARASAVFSGLQSGNYYRHGSLEWLTGANAGQRFDVRVSRDASPSGTLLAWAGLTASDVSVGDTARCIAGCDGRHSTCVAKFSNGRNFGGYKDMPGVKALIDYPPLRTT